MVIGQTPGRTYCLRCPGGRIGTGRLKALLELTDGAGDLTFMLSRRQALTLQGELKDVPSYLFRDLAAEGIQGPNVKSYPYRVDGNLQSYLIDQLSKLAKITSGMTFSYSPAKQYRSHLRLDDFCLQRLSSEVFRLEANIWTQGAEPLIGEIARRDLPALFTGLTDLFETRSDRSSLGSSSLREIRKRLLRSLNRDQSGSPASGEVPPDGGDGTVLDEITFVEAGSYRVQTSDGKNWLIVPVTAGVLSAPAVTKLVNVLRDQEIQSVRLTPEQNMLLPLTKADQAERIKEGLGENSIAYESPFYLPRITTCPGSRFCSDVENRPVSLASRLAGFFRGRESLANFNQHHPVGITGCGDTRTLEKRHSIGVYPGPGGTYRLSLGGDLTGEGRSGLELDRAFDPDEVPKTLERIVRSFRRSPESDLKKWVESSCLKSMS